MFLMLKLIVSSGNYQTTRVTPASSRIEISENDSAITFSNPLYSYASNLKPLLQEIYTNENKWENGTCIHDLEIMLALNNKLKKVAEE